MPAPVIQLQHVDKRFANGLLALRQVSLAVEVGEFVSLLGPSGCGKSTVLRLVAGLERPSAGVITAPPDGIAFVFQDAALMPWATVADNVRLPLRLAGMARRASASRVQGAIDAVGLSGFHDALPSELSGGMKMRASIARALVTQPRVLLMDEPFGALDDITRQRLNQDLLARWQAMPMAVLFVTHSVFEAAFLSQRVLVMGARPGRIVADVTIEEPHPRSPAFRTSASYLATCQRLTDALAAAHEAIA